MTTPQNMDMEDLPENTPEPPAWNAGASLAVLFLITVAGWSLLNLYDNGPRIADQLFGTEMPHTYQGIRRFFLRGDALVEENVLGKAEGWAMHAHAETFLGKSSMNNLAVVKGPDGRLFRGGMFSIPVENASALAVDVAELAEAAGECGIGLLALGTPDTVIKGAGNQPLDLPFPDYNVSVDAFLFTLRERGVPFLDGRHVLAENNFPVDRITPKTAFLLTGEAAFALFTHLVDALNSQFNLNLDPDGFFRDQANYTVTVHPRYFMGQLGKETGSAFGGVDDFEAFSPAFETEFRVEGLDMFGAAVDAKGGAEETLLNPDAFVYYDSLYNLYPEGYYRDTNAVWSKIVNLRNPDGPKLLVVHDFYTAQLITHLAPMCGELHTLIVREGHRQNALDYIQDKDFDGIVVSFFPQNLTLPQTRALILGDRLAASE